MDALDPLESLQMLQRDLVALLDSRLDNVDRLSLELEAHISDFQKLLDQNRRNEKSRALVQGSTITIDGTEYSVSPDFKDAILTVANEVDLDELEAAKLCLSVQEEMDQVDETLPYRAVLRFHTQRRTVLDCLKLVFRRSLDDLEDADEVGDMMQTVVQMTVQGGGYWRRCINGLTEIGESMTKTQNHIQTMLVTGQTTQSVRGEALQVQRMFLTQQHEALATIMCYLIRSHYVMPEDFRMFLTKAAASDLSAALLSHFTPILIAGSSRFGSDPATQQSAADDIHRVFSEGPAKLTWKNTAFGAAATVWWLVEYSGRIDKSTDLDKVFFRALDERAFHYMLSMADFYKPEVWHDPAKAGLVRFLLDGTDRFPREAVAPSPDFAQLTMQEVQVFTEALVSNMHGVLRELKTEEDSQRRNVDGTYEMHLERFLLITAYAYQDDFVAAMDFWGDTESNLYGFLRWTSRRLPTPRVAAFCEMLRSLANGEKAAASAHKFLLEDAAPGIRGRRTYSLSWQQMFSELELYASSIKNAPAAQGEQPDPDIVEAETPIMLEAYLRLIAHVIRNSTQAREWVLHEQAVKLHEIMLQLARSATLPAVQACCFEVLAALLTDCSADIRDGMWFALDNWLAGDDTRKQRREDGLYLQRIAADAEVASSFINLLNALLLSGRPGPDIDDLPFPDFTRRQGIDRYVDFVLAMAFAASASEPTIVEDRMQIYVLRHSCLAFIQACLASFNEDLASITSTDLKSFSTYAKLHPFARVMEHLFSDQVIAVLFQTVQQNPDELRTLPSLSPLVQAVCMAMSTMNLALDKQATYFDVVRPIIKTQTSRRDAPISNPAFASFEDVVLGHLSIVGYLAGYLSCPHDDVVYISVDLLKRVCASRKIAMQDRLVSRLVDSGEAIQVELRQYFTPEGADRLSKPQALLDLLITSLKSSTIPTLAHVMLGFDCHASTLSVGTDSLFSQGKSLFHSIASMAIFLPSDVDRDHATILQSTRRACFEILALLASSLLSSSIVIEELREIDFVAAVQASQTELGHDTTWSGVLASDSNVWLGDGATALQEFFRERDVLFSMLAEVGHVDSGFVLASLDFFDISLAPPMEVTSKLITDLKAATVGQVEQSLALEKRRLLKDGQDQQQIDDEISAILTSLTSRQRHEAASIARQNTLEAWVDLASRTLSKEMLQAVMPRLDRSLASDMPAASQFAKIVLLLVCTTDATSLEAREVVQYAYRTCLRAIQDSGTDAALRDVCYRICVHILSIDGTRSLQEASDRVVRVVAEDVFATRGVTRISALLFLDAVLRGLNKEKRSESLLRAFQKVNFLPVLIDFSITNMSAVFSDEEVDRSAALSYFHSAATVILRTAQAPHGAQMILNSSFITAVQDSGLFSTDPDIGLDIDNTAALQEFYRLLAAILRIFIAIVVGRGIGDGATLLLVRKFLSDNRMSMSAVFKLASRGMGDAKGEAQVIADQLEKLMHLTSFLDEDEIVQQNSSRQQSFA